MVQILKGMAQEIDRMTADAPWKERIMERLIFDSEEMKKIRDLLIDSDAVRCESVSPETPFPGVNSYLLFSSTHRVIVDFNKMAKAIYNAGYRKGEK
jgi:hypothetical protein